MRTALLATGGEGPARDRLAARFRDFDLVCAADSGLELLHAWGLGPDLIVGDMDSLSDASLPSAYPGAELLVYPRHKDESDTELGLRLLHERGVDEVVLAGGGEGRLDHLLAVRALFERVLRPREWYTAKERVLLVRSGETRMLETRAGAVISVFPLGEGASDMGSEGLRWPLGGLSWGRGDFSLSNEALGERVVLRAGRGDLLLLAAYD